MTDDPNAPQVIVRVATEVEASIIAGQLQLRGISSEVEGGFVSGFKAEAPGDVAVVVKQCDLMCAKKALEEIQEDKTDFDWSQVDVGQPE